MASTNKRIRNGVAVPRVGQTRPVPLRLTEEEISLLSEAAAACGTNLSAFIRDVALAQARKTVAVT